MNRREALRKGRILAGACFLCQGKVSFALSRNECYIDSNELDKLKFRTHSIFSSFTITDPIIPFSGNEEFDRALGRQLVNLAITFSVRPGFGYVNDSDGLNAKASPQTRIANTKGTVLFGIGFLRKLLLEGSGGDVAVLGICAHEFGHIHQFFSGDYQYLRPLHQTPKLIELHADYLAGYFLGKLKRERPGISLRRFGEFLYSAGTMDFTDPDFHGTPLERIRAAEEGFEMAARSTDFEYSARHGRNFTVKEFS